MNDDRTEEEREYDLFLIELGDSISPAARRELAPLLAAAHHNRHPELTSDQTTTEPCKPSPGPTSPLEES